MKPLDSSQLKVLNVLLNLKYCLVDHDLIVLDIDGNMKKTSVCIDVDKTATEALYNHIHFDNLFSRNISLEERRKFTTIIADTLYSHLKRDFPLRKFKIYIEIDEGCLTIRFTQIHSNEDSWLNEDDFIDQINAGDLVVFGD